MSAQIVPFPRPMETPSPTLVSMVLTLRRDLSCRERVFLFRVSSALIARRAAYTSRKRAWLTLRFFGGANENRSN